MSMDIVVPIATYPDATSRVGLGRLLAQAARWRASLTVLIEEVSIPPVHAPLGDTLAGVSTMATAAEHLSTQRAADTRRWIEDRAAELSIPVAISVCRCRAGGFAAHCVPVARYHDLAAVVVDSNGPGRQGDVERLIFGSGGPVLVLPETDGDVLAPETADSSGKVVLAWDGSLAASRALRAALPILHHADRVLVLTIGDDKDIDPDGTAGVLAHLDRHGIRARHLQRSRGSAFIGDRLQAVAIAENAELLVMGAFSRNRLRDFILGGATRSVLQETRLPVLFAH